MYLSIRNKILFSHFGIVLFVGLAIGGSAYYFIATNIYTEGVKDIEFMAKTLKFRVLDAVNRKKDKLQSVDASSLELYSADHNQYDLSKYLSGFATEFPVLSYTKLNGGQTRAVNGIIYEGKVDTLNSPIFRALQSDPNKTIVSYEQNNIDLGVPAVTLAMAKQGGGAVIGFIKASVPIADIASVLSETPNSGFVMLIDRKKTVIYAANNAAMAGTSIDNISAKGHADLIKPGINRTSILGVDSIAALAPVEGLQCSVLVVVPMAVLQAEADKIKYAAAGILFVVLAVSAVVFTLITRTIDRNITKPLRQFISLTKMIARGSYAQITGIKSKDEAGVLAASFNKMLMELKKTRDDLAKAKDYSDHIIQTIASAVMVLDEDAVITTVNKSVQNMLGRTEDELIGRRIDDIFDSDTVAEILYNEIMKNGTVKDVEVVLTAKYGVKIPVIFSASLIHGGKSQRADEIVCSMHNISQLKRMQRVRDIHLNELETANKHLKDSRVQLVQAEKLASLGQMLAGVAHEINTPVGIGITLSSTIAKDTQGVRAAFDDKSLRMERLREYLDDVDKASSLILKSLMRTADLIKSFKMVSADQITQERRRFRLREYIEEILLSLQPNMKRTRHSIEVICGKDMELDSYPGAIAQIITNLLMNSLVHAYGEGQKGVITIEAGFNSKDMVFIKYADNGRGMPHENLKRIYDPFFTTMRGAGGTGLGLHIVHNIVTQTLGGTIECRSEPDVGTEFTIKFPALKKEAAA